MQLDATASVPGTFAYSPAAGAVLKAGSQTLSVTFTPTDTTDYTTATGSVTLDVAQATPTITWAAPGPIVYGTSLGAAQLDATTDVPGSFAYTPAAGTVLGAGVHTLSMTFTPTDASDYTTTTATTTIAVSQATPSITWSAPASMTYGTALGAAQLDATADVPGSFAYSPSPGTVPGAGSHTLSVTFTPTDSTDYATATASTTLSVSQAAPTITWTTAAAIEYGTPLGAVQLDATADVPGSFAYSTVAGTVLGAGSHTLSVTFTPADSTDYTTATGTTTITVSQATPTLTWGTPAPIDYGTALGAIQFDATANVPGSFAYTPAAGTILTAGNHTLSVTFTPSDATDYTTATATASITVARATPTVIVVGGGTYDGSPIPATASVAGVVAGVDSAPGPSLQGASPTMTYYAGSAAAGPPLTGPPTTIGTYTVVASFPGSADYSGASGLPVTFRIMAPAASVTLVASAGSSLFGQSVTLTATASLTCPGAGMPTGTVTFYDGGATLGEVPLDSSGRAALTVGGLGLGGHSIAAVYSGDARSSGGRSEGLSESVTPADTRVILVPHAVLKRKKIASLSLTAEVEPLAPGGGVPGGMVTFLVKKKALGTAALSGGQATLAVRPGNVLDRSITVSYSGATGYRSASLASPRLTTGSLKAPALAPRAGPMARASEAAAHRHPRRNRGGS
jgi:hypothetical protein